MKNSRNTVARIPFVCLALLLTSCLGTLPAAAMSGGNFTLDWTDVPGGGGTLTGGTFELRGSAGHSDAGFLSSGTLALRSGFWNYRNYLLGDVNEDGRVNVGDLQLMVYAWGSTSGTGAPWNPYADLNEDGAVSVVDLQTMVVNWARVL